MNAHHVNDYGVCKAADNIPVEPRNAEKNGSLGANLSLSLDNSEMLKFQLYEDNFLLEEIDKIIRKRWRRVGQTTRYGWLAAFSQKPTIPQEESRILSSLANKVGFENCREAIDRIQSISQNLHPRDIPAAAIAILFETDTALMLKQCRGPKYSPRRVRDRFPTIFTISESCYH